ncbi:DNA polymerase III, delta subunit [Marinospirillum celere]|uniref:DNA polymerase III subunit delta n=1 Tax=Marinospirillum celere TaxID=1122252 RepID=A0A1I1DSQ0_9GAMM|nr:DNA polymerase III subunit delta [Marinospirillum celere]SFB78049.1 DNA polymerase III, delta subunit [Marinospirillum celere]
MKATPDKLPGLLQKKLPPVIWVSGDEPLQLLETTDLIRRRARETGIEEREVQEAGANFAWKQLIEASASLSLFGGSKLVEIRMASNKPGKEGSEVIQQLCKEAANTPDILLFTSPKLDAAQQKSAWYKALDQVGLHVAIWPIEASRLPAWINQRFQQAGIQVDSAAVQLLTEKVEGNLLAASQEIEKLRLFVEPGQLLTADQLINLIEDASRYSLFDLADACLEGKADRAVKILYGLQAEGTEAPLLLWALTREIRQTGKLLHHLKEGLPFDSICKQLAIWDRRKPLYRKASQRLKLKQTHQLLLLAEQADQAIKGSGEPLNELILKLVIGFAKNPN